MEKYLKMTIYIYIHIYIYCIYTVHIYTQYIYIYIYTYKKDLHNPDNHNGVITHIEPDILECEVKWTLERITTNKASGCDGIPVELFQI